MSKFGDIITFINTTLKTEQFSSSRFQKGTFNDSIAELVKSSDDGETMPCVISNTGTTTKLVIDDTKTMQVYHRMMGSNYELVENDFGFRTRRSIANMSLVFIGDRERLQVTKEDIILGLNNGMPLEMPKTNRVALSIESCNITPQTYITDFNEVYEREFNIQQKLLKPQTIMIALDYEITMDIMDGCVLICE